MMKILSATALAAGLAFVAFADASAWERKARFTSPRGTTLFEASGACAGGTCTRSATRTTAKGRSFAREGTRSCSNGACSVSRTFTGAHGQTFTRESSITR
ncbi:MAG: hypothetical protein AAGC79_10790 [Pseudomonadota bacterium]